MRLIKRINGLFIVAAIVCKSIKVTYKALLRYRTLDCVFQVILARQVVALELLESGRISEAADCLRQVLKASPSARDDLVTATRQVYKK